LGYTGQNCVCVIILHVNAGPPRKSNEPLVGEMYGQEEVIEEILSVNQAVNHVEFRGDMDVRLLT
jgi:hypothetical protein